MASSVDKTFFIDISAVGSVKAILAALSDHSYCENVKVRFDRFMVGQKEKPLDRTSNWGLGGPSARTYEVQDDTRCLFSIVVNNIIC